MEFDSTSGQLSCGSCGRHDDIQEFSDDFITQEFSEEDDAQEYHCENCGASIITTKDTSATSCSFCGAGVVLADRIQGQYAPVKVIPFTISKEEAEAAFKKWSGKKAFVPDDFKHANRIKGITGIYVPYWLYDMNSRAIVDGRGQRVRTYTLGDYIYTETKHYKIHRDLDVHYDLVPADASEKLSDEMMDKLEPFNYQELVQFKSPYLAGYIAERYHFSDEELVPRIDEKIKDYTENYIKSTIRGYTSTQINDKQITSKQKNTQYVLFPIWMFYYDVEGVEHTFAMNGQTGKVVGKPPFSSKKAIKYFLKVAGITFVAVKAGALLVGGPLF